MNITIKSQQTNEQGEVEEFLQHTQGTLQLWDDGFLLTYQEEKGTGLQGSTSLRYKESTLSLVRTGEVHWENRFDTRNPCHSAYHTAYGDFETQVNTQIIDCDMREEGGQINVEYLLELQGGSPTKVIFHVEVHT